MAEKEVFSCGHALWWVSSMKWRSNRGFHLYLWGLGCKLHYEKQRPSLYCSPGGCSAAKRLGIPAHFHMLEPLSCSTGELS